jgi:phosphoenolpyruvate carboxykinase (ATP)
MLKKGDAQLFTHYALQLKDTSVPIADPESDCCPQLKQKGFLLDGTVILHNAPPALLYEEAMKHEEGTYIVSTGALATRSGAKTGRSPGDKRIVDEDSVRENVWWGSVNIKLSQRSFNMNRARALDYLNTRKQLFVVDGYAGWDERHRQKIRVVSTRAYHALFMYNMLIRPNMEELAHFGDPDYYIYNAGEFVANQLTEGNTSPCSITISFEKREMVLLGTQYAGEMKKGVFTIMHYLMPKAGVLSLHASANEGEAGDVSLFFGLSGTGKTTLSADTRRKLIGDDEHCWSENGVFNIEGGCYAKTASLSAKAEPEIWAAIRFGTVLENIVFDSDTREVDYEDISITENTRAAYPIDYISSAKAHTHTKNISSHSSSTQLVTIF